MESKTRSLLICVFMAALIVALTGFALTYGRFSQEQSAEEGNYGGDIEYVVADQIEVKDMNEFIGAIENGYSNIIVSGEAQDTIIVSAGVTDVGVDLIINLNGHKIVRNNREPILNVKNGIRLTIIDTSEQKTGAFYNPVGSVLQISGGTLTVSGGLFESGPRKSEYYGGGASSVATEVYVKSGDTYVKAADNYIMPVVPAGQTGVYYETALQGNSFVTADTYLYYTSETTDYEIIVAAERGSADFYYTYSDGDNVAVVYGYNNVKSSATQQSAHYATVSMQSGNMYARGGQYNSYFGLDTTYGIYADGGYMAVESGAFSVIEDGTCIRCNYSSVSDSDYLRVSGGSFRSEWGDTIQVNGGKLAVSGGLFDKDASSLTDASQNGSAVIRVNSGVLDGSSALSGALNFNIKGSDVYGVYADGSDIRVSLANASFDFDGDYGTTAIYAAGGSITVADSVFHIRGNNGYGIQSEKSAAGAAAADVEINGCVFQMTGGQSTGVSIQEGSVSLGETAKNPYTMFYIDRVDNCYGVLAGDRPGETSSLAASGEITVNINSAQFFMGQTVAGSEGGSFSGAGVYANADNSQINIQNAFFITAGNGSSGIYAEKGSVTQSGQNSKLVIVTGAVYNNYTAGGSNASGWIYFPRAAADYTAGVALDVRTSDVSQSYGIYTADGNVSLSGAYIAVYSDSASGVITARGGDVSADTLDVDVRTKGNSNADYLTTTAVSTQNGGVSLGNATVNTDSLGITAQGGNVSVSGELTLVSSRGTAIYVNGGDLNFGELSDVNITSTIDGSCRWGSAGATRPYSYDGVYIQGGSLSARGNFDVLHGGVENDYQYANNGDTLYRQFVIKSYAVRVESSQRANSSVSIAKGRVENTCGGGVYVREGGAYTVDVTLGEQGNNNLQILTTGTTLYDDLVYISGAANNWAYRLSRTGGHAVEVNGGTLTINGGNYSAAQGEGILVRSGTVNVYGGVYSGNDNYTSDGGLVAGPAASYSFKMFGGTVNVYGGTFGSADSSGSGAFIMGNSASDMADANIYGGTFVVGGQAGFSIFDYTDILFAPRGGQNGEGGDIKVSGTACAIAVENRTAPANIVINGGEFYSTGPSGDYDGIWYSNSNAGLTISGGTFTGSARSGLFFATLPNSGKVQISGGTFVGTSSNNAISGNYYQNSILANGCYIVKNGNTWEVRG